jgi:diketogulonate reductase-like aldo/keto reductase
VAGGDPAYVRAACEASLERLYLDCIDLYYQRSSTASTPAFPSKSQFVPPIFHSSVKYKLDELYMQIFSSLDWGTEETS